MTDIVPQRDALGSFMTLREAFGVADDAPWVLPFHAFLLRGDGWTALVDTGVGPPGDDPFLPDRQGWLGGRVPRDEIDVVLLTHMHVDHVGWNMLGGEPFFPHARYIGRREDYEFFTQTRPDRPYVREQLLGLHDSGRLELLDEDASPLPGVRLEHCGGHTPGHTIVRVDGAGVVLADVVVHELQLADPGLAYAADEDADAAAAVRGRLLAELADSGSLVALGHFEQPLGRIERAGAGYAWAPLS